MEPGGCKSVVSRRRTCYCKVFIVLFGSGDYFARLFCDFGLISCRLDSVQKHEELSSSAFSRTRYLGPKVSICLNSFLSDVWVQVIGNVCALTATYPFNTLQTRMSMEVSNSATYTSVLREIRHGRSRFIVSD